MVTISKSLAERYLERGAAVSYGVAPDGYAYISHEDGTLLRYQAIYLPKPVTPQVTPATQRKG